MTTAMLVRIMIAYLYGPVPLSTEPMKNTRNCCDLGANRKGDEAIVVIVAPRFDGCSRLGQTQEYISCALSASRS